jgi:hypothetical protein
MQGSPFRSLVAKSAQTGLCPTSISSLGRAGAASLHRGVARAALNAMRSQHRLTDAFRGLAKVGVSDGSFAGPASLRAVSISPSLKREDRRT